MSKMDTLMPSLAEIEAASPAAPYIPTSPRYSHGRRLGLNLVSRRRCSKTEITQVGITPLAASSPPSNLDAFAIYADAQAGQSWVDVFSIRSQRGHTKAAGSHAVLAPLGGVSGGRFASLGTGKVQVGRCAERHGSSLVVRDLASGKTVLDIKEATGGPLAWSREGGSLAAGEAGDRVGVWDARSGARIGRVVGHIDEVTHAAFRPDFTLVTLSRDGWVRITDPRSARTLGKLEVDRSRTRARALGVSPDGETIVSLWGSTLHMWLPGAGQLTSYGLHAARGTEGWPLCISPDCRWMACRTEDGFDVVDVASGSVAWEEQQRLCGGEAAMVTAGAFSTDARVLVLGRMDGVVEVWDVEEREG